MRPETLINAVYGLLIAAVAVYGLVSAWRRRARLREQPDSPERNTVLRTETVSIRVAAVVLLVVVVLLAWMWSVSCDRSWRQASEPLKDTATDWTFWAVMALALGAVGSVASLVGNFLTPELGVKPEGNDDTPMNRYRYTKYGGFTKRGTLYGSLVCLGIGVALTGVLVATGNWNLE